MTRKAIAVCLVLVTSGCAVSRQDMTQADDDEGRMTALLSQLDSLNEKAKALSTASNDSHCPEVCDVASSICGVADKICDIASRHPDRTDYASRCSDAKATCARSRDDCSHRCKH